MHQRLRGQFLVLYLGAMVVAAVNMKEIIELLQTRWAPFVVAAFVACTIGAIVVAFLVPADTAPRDPHAPFSIYQPHGRRFFVVAVLLAGVLLVGGVLIALGWLSSGRGERVGNTEKPSTPPPPPSPSPGEPPAITPPDPPRPVPLPSDRLAHLTRSVAVGYTKVPGDHTMTVLDEDGCSMRVRWRGAHDLVVEDGSVTFEVEPESDAEERLVRMFATMYEDSVGGFVRSLSRAVRTGGASVSRGRANSYYIEWDRFSITARLSADSLLNELLVSERGAEVPKYRLQRRPSEPGGFRGTAELAAALRTLHAGL